MKYNETRLKLLNEMPPLVRLEVERLIESYERLRQFYLQELELQIPLLENVRDMNQLKLQLKGESFLGYGDAEDESLRKLKHLKEYLEKFPDSWDYKYYDSVIQSIPKTIEDETLPLG